MNGFDGCLELPTCRPQATALAKLLIEPATAGTSFEKTLAIHRFAKDFLKKAASR